MNPTFRSETTGDEVVSAYPDAVKGRTFLVTGPSPTGIGASTLLALAKAKPGTLILAGRTPASFQSVADQIAAIDASIKTILVRLDLASMSSVHRAGAAILANADVPRIDVLINNAGIMASPYGKTVDGIEQQFGTNHIGHFLLTAILLPKILAAPRPRIVNLSSSGHRMGTGDYSDYNWEKTPYDLWTAYGQSKLANIYFTNELVRRYGAQGLQAYSVHPGSVSTDLVRHVSGERVTEREKFFRRVAADPEWESRRLKNLADGCSTTLVAALTPNLQPNGAFLSDCQLGNPKATTRDVQAAEKLWELSERLIGHRFGEST